MTTAARQRRYCGPRIMPKPPGEWDEDDLLRNVLDLADDFGWLAYHQRPALTSKGWRTAIQGDAGFPDLVLVRAPRVLFVELKKDDGRTGPFQKKWLTALAECSSVEVYGWRPANLDAIGECLR